MKGHRTQFWSKRCAGKCSGWFSGKFSLLLKLDPDKCFSLGKPRQSYGMLRAAAASSRPRRGKAEKIK